MRKITNTRQAKEFKKSIVSDKLDEIMKRNNEYVVKMLKLACEKGAWIVLCYNEKVIKCKYGIVQAERKLFPLANDAVLTFYVGQEQAKLYSDDLNKWKEFIRNSILSQLNL